MCIFFRPFYTFWTATYLIHFLHRSMTLSCSRWPCPASAPSQGLSPPTMWMPPLTPTWRSPPPSTPTATLTPSRSIHPSRSQFTTCARVCVCVCACACLRAHTSVCVSVFVSASVYVHVCVLRVCVRMCVCVYHPTLV